MNFADWLINEMNNSEDDYCEYCSMVRPCDCDLGDDWGGEEIED